MISRIEYIKNKVSRRSMLEQLAEESTELGKAALKLIRAAGFSENVTPVTEAEAMEDLEEEMHDVLFVLFMLGFMEMDAAELEDDYKTKRWADRLGYWKVCGNEGNEIKP